ncbi:ribosomal L32p family protein [Plectosphaerella plurivora]|uniref:Large ribosomal subunit protein bL32m n=1 Tax=Plectosphaerella plurivora TaxID=936078 RepID=A0A9P8VM69_9PEZI|nr:ribosomal L32p family protein [Plectosphaerella plurivora]
MATAIGATLPLRTPSILPRLSAPTLLRSSRTWSLFSRQVSFPLWPSLSFAYPAVHLNIPAWLGDIWEGILKAVPKKKTTHSKMRSRQMAGKALQDVLSICKCPGCGQPKRRHVVCPHCASDIKRMWQRENPSGKFT